MLTCKDGVTMQRGAGQRHGLCQALADHVLTGVLQLPRAVQEKLDKLKFFAKPKLALDAVGGASAVRLSDALSEVFYAAQGQSCCTCI